MLTVVISGHSLSSSRGLWRVTMLLGCEGVFGVSFDTRIVVQNKLNTR